MTVTEPRPAASKATIGPHTWRVDIPGAEQADFTPIKWNLYLALVGLALGALMGLLQALERLDVNLYENVGLETYYQGLTLHGVALALVFTFCFSWTTTIDPQFTRVLFWFTGHPIVYFWLLPVYVSWYMMLPKQAGGKLYSDGLTRMVFITFLLLIPVGVHHQFTDPGIAFSSKTIQWLLTFGIFFPSLVTLFSVVAGLEMGARANGGRGHLMWVKKLPWGNPVVSGQLLAGLGFMLGGMSGLINASYTVNVVVHNTSYIPGHFHLTVGTAVALSIMAISYWFVPYLTGRELWGRKWAVAQTWLWMIGVLIFSRGQMMGGLDGMPRRTAIAEATYLDAPGHSSWAQANTMTGIGGTIMFLAAVLFFVVILRTVYSSARVTEVQVTPVSEVIHGPKVSWAIFDQIWVWVVTAAVLIVIVYGEVIFHYLPLNSVSPGIRLW